MRIVRGLSKALLVAATAAVLAVIVPEGGSVWAHEFCAVCQDVCVNGTGGGNGCSVYYGRPGYYTWASCPVGSSDQGQCKITITNTCYTYYTVCETGMCAGSSCPNGVGCSAYSYTTVNAGALFTGPTNCI